MQNISPKIQNQIAMLQQIQQQLQTILSQKNQYEMAVREAKRAQEE
ncbi:MAG: prefoldin subunit beta, partial [Methanoregula sp.]